MKKIILSILCMGIAGLYAQPTITQAQFTMPVGDVFTSYTQGYTVPSQGPGQTWNFTGLNTSILGNTTTFIDQSTSSVSGLPASTLCVERANDEECFLIDASGMRLTGRYLSLATVSQPYQVGQYFFHFPITYGSSHTDNFHSNYSYLGPTSRNGSVTIDVTGYGTLQLPNSLTINNAMLVRTHEVYTDSIGTGPWEVDSFDVIMYSFYAAAFSGPILTFKQVINENGTFHFGHYHVLSTVGLETIDISGNLELYPNPAENVVTLTNNGNIDITGYEYKIIDMQGAIIKTGIINTENPNFDVTTLNTGLYILQVNGEPFNASKRFIKK